MKNIISKLLLSFLLLSFFSVKAQSAKDEVQMIQSIWGMEKRTIVTDYLKLTESEASKFWPLYDAYQADYKKLGEERIYIIADYVNNITTMTNEKADNIATRLLKNNTAVDALQLKYFKKMKKKVSALRAAQFMQLDLYLQTMIRSELQNSIPFIGELDKKMK